MALQNKFKLNFQLPTMLMWRARSLVAAAVFYVRPGWACDSSVGVVLRSRRRQQLTTARAFFAPFWTPCIWIDDDRGGTGRFCSVTELIEIVTIIPGREGYVPPLGLRCTGVRWKEVNYKYDKIWPLCGVLGWCPWRICVGVGCLDLVPQSLFLHSRYRWIVRNQTWMEIQL